MPAVVVSRLVLVALVVQLPSADLVSTAFSFSIDRVAKIFHRLFKRLAFMKTLLLE